jgi:hypothetical protein
MAQNRSHAAIFGLGLLASSVGTSLHAQPSGGGGGVPICRRVVVPGSSTYHGPSCTIGSSQACHDTQHWWQISNELCDFCDEAGPHCLLSCGNSVTTSVVVDVYQYGTCVAPGICSGGEVVNQITYFRTYFPSPVGCPTSP